MTKEVTLFPVGKRRWRVTQGHYDLGTYQTRETAVLLAKQLSRWRPELVFSVMQEAV